MGRYSTRILPEGALLPPPLASAIACCAFGVSPGEVAALSRRSPRSARARHTAMYLAHVGFGLGFSAVGRAFQRDPSSVRHACALIEDRRDEARFDCLMLHLEWASREFAASLRPAPLRGPALAGDA